MTNNNNGTCRIGFIGTGVMGKPMAEHLLDAGYPLTVFTRTKVKAEELIYKGAQWKDSVADVAMVSDIVITIVGFPSDVEEVYFGKNGIISNVAPGSTLIDMTTTKPSLAKKIFETALAAGVDAIDAPVSGGDKGARSGSLSIMVGGKRNVFEKIMPIFKLMGSNIVYQGNAGSGQHTKMANQIAIASTILGVSEALVYAKKEGLDPLTVLSSIENGAAGSWTMSNLGPKMVKGDFDPGFFIKHFIKDLVIADEESDKIGQNLPGLKLSKSLFEKLLSLGRGEMGTQALYSLFD